MKAVLSLTQGLCQYHVTSTKQGLGCGFSRKATAQTLFCWWVLSCWIYLRKYVKKMFFYNFPTLRLHIGSWYPSLWKLWTCLSHIINEVAADDLVTCSVSVSWNIPLSAPAGPTTNEPCYKSICWYYGLKTTPSVWIFPGIFMLWISTIIKSHVEGQHRDQSFDTILHSITLVTLMAITRSTVPTPYLESSHYNWFEDQVPVGEVPNVQMSCIDFDLTHCGLVMSYGSRDL